MWWSLSAIVPPPTQFRYHRYLYFHLQLGVMIWPLNWPSSLTQHKCLAITIKATFFSSWLLDLILTFRLLLDPSHRWKYSNLCSTQTINIFWGGGGKITQDQNFKQENLAWSRVLGYFDSHSSGKTPSSWMAWTPLLEIHIDILFYKFLLTLRA